MPKNLRDSKGKPLRNGFYNYEGAGRNYLCYLSCIPGGFALYYTTNQSDYLTRKNQTSRLTRLSEEEAEAEINNLDLKLRTFESLFTKLTGNQTFSERRRDGK